MSPSEPKELPLARWSLNQALIMLVSSVAAWGVRYPWPAGVAAIGSFAWLLVWCRGGYTPSGAFGLANAVTTLRLGAVVAIGTVLHGLSAPLIGAVVLVIFALDGVDGWLARRTGSASAFGAHFDMETDACLVLVLGLELWLRDRLGAWIVVPGLLRYLYVLCLAVWPARRGDHPRSKLGRRAFVALVSGLALSFLSDGLIGTLGAGVGAALVTFSFAKSFAWSYGR